MILLFDQPHLIDHNNSMIYPTGDWDDYQKIVEWCEAAGEEYFSMYVIGIHYKNDEALSMFLMRWS